MAKWTKRNNPHTWGKKKGAMARTKTQIIRYAPPRTVAPIIRVSAPRAAPHKKKHHKHGGGGALSQKHLMALAIGGALYGFIEKSFGAQLPTLPVVGRAGTITLGAYMLGKGRGGGVLHDVARAGAVIAGYQIGSTGKIAGEGVDGTIVPQVSGIAAQV
jgi:hypothetical protein